MKRTGEFVLGLIGGIIGILASLSGTLFGALATSMGVDQGGAVSTASWIALVLSVLGLIGACIVKKNSTLASIFMLIAGIGGFICISMLYIVAGILFVIAGVMGLVRRDKTASA